MVQSGPKLLLSSADILLDATDEGGASVAAENEEQQQAPDKKGYRRQPGHRILNAKVTRDDGGLVPISGSDQFIDLALTRVAQQRPEVVN
jgi:hypothetical protein